MKAYENIVQLLAKADVEKVFTLPSSGFLSLVSELYEYDEADFDVVETRHEQNAVAMADSYSRASDEIGFCIVGMGPAISQTGLALGTAEQKGSNVLVLATEPSTSGRFAPGVTFDPKAFRQESFLYSFFDDVVSIRDPATVQSDFSRALRRVKAGQGPVAVQIAGNVLSSDIPDDPIDDRSLFGITGTSSKPEPPRGTPSEAAIDEFVETYLDSDATVPPVIVAGDGAVKSDARESIVQLAEQMNALLVSSLQAKNYLSDHPFYLGFTGNYGSVLANRYLSEADLVVGIGCSLNPFTTDSGHLLRDEAKVIHVDSNPSHIGRYAPVDCGIVGDADTTAEAMARALEREGLDRSGVFWTDSLKAEIEEFDPWEEASYSQKADRIDPRELMDALDEILPEGRSVSFAPSHNGCWVLDGITVTRDDNLLFTGDLAAIGLELQFGIGAAATSSENTSIAFCGDVAFMMACQEVDTAVRHDLPVITIVLNDDAAGSEAAYLESHNQSIEPALVRTPDIAGMARSMGAEGYTVRDRADIEDLEDVLGGDPAGPIVVDCKIDRDVLHRAFRGKTTGYE